MTLVEKRKQFTKRVKLGVKWLDENNKGWMKNIKISELDTQDRRTCMVGQVYGDFWERINGGSEGKMTLRQSMGNGFNLSDKDDRQIYWDLLTKVWVDKIKKLKTKKKTV